MPPPPDDLRRPAAPGQGGLGFDEPGVEELVDAQYAGPRSALRPIFERVRTAVEGLGAAQLEARKTHVAFVHGRRFALVRPSTRTRLDVGLVLPGVAAAGRLEEAGSFGGARTTHRVRLASPEDVDAELVAWLARAYESARRP